MFQSKFISIYFFLKSQGFEQIKEIGKLFESLVKQNYLLYMYLVKKNITLMK